MTKALNSAARRIDLLQEFGPEVLRLPVVLRLLLENVLRCANQQERAIGKAALSEWLTRGTSEAEIPFQPSRVLMHDTTSTPALVDVAAMRDALREEGVDPRLLQPILPVDVSVDHSLAVEAFAQADAAAINMSYEMRRNAERYRFLRWASEALPNVKIHPPGTGIMHTLNLEQLATVVTRLEGPNGAWLAPDMMLGTDSHTPMIGGIGVLGWGVGGLEAQTVMFGLPTMLRIPEVVGVRLIGRLRGAAQATDLALVVTNRLRQLGVAGDFVEFYGDGVSTLTAGQRCVVANMAPEYGATTGFFPVDDMTIAYLLQTGRSAEHVAFVKDYCQGNSLWFDPNNSPRYTRSIEIKLDEIGIQIAGPQRPQDLHDYNDAGRALAAFAPAKPAEPNEGADCDLPRFPVAIAAITSCTNTSDPALLLAAALLARKARALGLKSKPWVKTSLAPGSPAAAAYLKRSGLLADLAELGFDIVGYGCTTCIGNPGPLPEAITRAQQRGQHKGVAILSGNRNFPGRVHPDLELSFIMSPLLVIAFALAGNAEIAFRDEPICRDSFGGDVYLRDLLPSQEEIDHAVALAIDRGDFKACFEIASANPLWKNLESPSTACFPWGDDSNALRRPPFASIDQGTMLGRFVAHPLLILGDDVTTDHISPASAIPKQSLVADFLVSRGENRDDLNVFASRRGNWQVMLRAAFHNKSLVNHLRPNLPVAHTLHVPSGEVLPIWEAAHRYRKEGVSVIVVAGERYGTGSSRDWAAKGQRLLGIRAVVASSFERIHRSNLIGMGILPLCFEKTDSIRNLKPSPSDQWEIDASAEKICPRGRLDALLHRADGKVESLRLVLAVETQFEVELLQKGGVIPFILASKLAAC